MSEDLFLKYLRKDLKPYVKESDCCEGIVELRKEIARLEEENERYRIAINEMAIIISKAIEYLTDEGVCILNKGMKENERLVWTWENYYDLLDILKGSDK